MISIKHSLVVPAATLLQNAVESDKKFIEPLISTIKGDVVKFGIKSSQEAATDGSKLTHLQKIKVTDAICKDLHQLDSTTTTTANRCKYPDSRSISMDLSNLLRLKDIKLGIAT